jgi:hypothetical protein
MTGYRLLLIGGSAGAALTLLSAGAFAQGELAAVAAAESVEIRATRIASFEKGNPSRQRFGRLEFRGGLVLASDNEKFGGLSDLVVAADGRRFTAVSDGGNWVAGEIVYDGTRPVALAKARLGPLLAMSGRVLERKRDHDAEGMALLDGSLTRGTVLIAFERNQRIGRFPVRDGAIFAPTGYIRLPAESRRMQSNRGVEAVTVLQGGPHKGSVLAIAERLADADDNHTGWLWIEDTPRHIAIRNSAAFDITSAAALGDGAVIILERYFRWAEGIKMRLRYLKPATLASGTAVDGEMLFEADMSYEIDNMEGIAVHKGGRGETVLTLVSDNNFNTFLQRTLLLQFAVLAEGLADAGAR